MQYFKRLRFDSKVRLQMIMYSYTTSFSTLWDMRRRKLWKVTPHFFDPISSNKNWASVCCFAHKIHGLDFNYYNHSVCILVQRLWKIQSMFKIQNANEILRFLVKFMKLFSLYQDIKTEFSFLSVFCDILWDISKPWQSNWWLYRKNDQWTKMYISCTKDKWKSMTYRYTHRLFLVNHHRVCTCQLCVKIGSDPFILSQSYHETNRNRAWAKVIYT